MKGIVFTEFLEMVEDGFGIEVMDALISASGSKSQGVYTGVGTYDYRELLRMVVKLSDISNTPSNELVTSFGRYLFNSFTRLYPIYFENVSTTFDFLENVESYIHQEVLKLYPDAQVPEIKTSRNQNTLRLLYTSPRCLGALAEGMLLACAQHFQENIRLQQSDRSQGKGSTVEFFLERVHD